MAKWIEVKANYDHRWPSGAVTALKAGTVVYVKDEVAEGAVEKKAAKETTKPKEDDPRWRATGTRAESNRRVPTAATNETAPVIQGGFPGYPDAATRMRALANGEAGDNAPGVRIEDVAVTAADNAATEKAEAAAEAKKNG